MGGWKPQRAAPVGIPALDSLCRFAWLVPDTGSFETEWMLLVIFGEATNPVGRKKFLRIPYVLQNPGKLAGVNDGKHVALPLNRVAGIADQIRAIADEPLDVPEKFGIRIQILPIDHLNGIERNQADHGAQAKPVEGPIGQPKHVVKEA